MIVSILGEGVFVSVGGRLVPVALAVPVPTPVPPEKPAKEKR